MIINKDLITVITVTYNCVNDIEDTIRSVISQDYPNIEYIIIDGASTDGTVDVVKKYEKHITKIVSEPDNGLYDAMNKGIRMASGKWINFMNAGDMYNDNHTISMLFENLGGRHIKVLYGNTIYIGRNGESHLHPTSTIKKLQWTINRYQPYTHQAVFYNIEFKEDCYYNTKYRIAADFDVACRYWNKYGINAYHYVPIPVCQYKAFDGVSSAPHNRRKAFKEKIMIKICNKMNLIEILKDMFRYMTI